MRVMALWLCLLLLPCCCECQPAGPAALGQPLGRADREMVTIDIHQRNGVLRTLLPPSSRPLLRDARVPRPASQSPKRAPQGSRFALSLDVPTSILSVLIDLAKNHDMRAKAAANAELMARIGKRK